MQRIQSTRCLRPFIRFRYLVFCTKLAKIYGRIPSLPSSPCVSSTQLSEGCRNAMLLHVKIGSPPLDEEFKIPDITFARACVCLRPFSTEKKRILTRKAFAIKIAHLQNLY